MVRASLIRKIAAEVPSFDAIPLFGYTPPFDWVSFSSNLAERFGVANLEVRVKSQKWRSGGELKEGLGNHWLIVPLTLTPIASPLYWAIGRADLEKLTSWMLNGKAEGSTFTSEILQEGFYRYLLLQALDAAMGCPPLEQFTPELGEESSFPENGAFSIDITASFDKRVCWGRLMISEAFRKEWVAHFAHLASEYVPSALSHQMPLVIGIKTGSAILSQKEWARLKSGDFVLLDEKSYDARKSQGVATLMLGTVPLFQIKIKQNKIELLDYAFTPEESMQQPPTSLESQEEEVSPIKDLPLNVSVEIGRLKITLDQLMHLQPGNTLEFPIHPDQGVSLVVSGQKVGRAELVHLGESLGVRILEIG